MYAREKSYDFLDSRHASRRASREFICVGVHKHPRLPEPVQPFAQSQRLSYQLSVVMLSDMESALPNGNAQAENRSSKADVWFMKPILFNGRETKIITQNFNG